MAPVNRQLPTVKPPSSLLALPAMDDVCQPLELARYIRDLGHHINEQLGLVAQYQQKNKTTWAALAGQHFIFSCYQLLSMMVALQCWSSFHQECVEQHHIIIDNLTGVMAPGPGKEAYAAVLLDQLFKSESACQTARRVYQFTSAFLHSYPHLCSVGAELCTVYRDPGDHWHRLGPWLVEDAVTAMSDLLQEWQ